MRYVLVEVVAALVRRGANAASVDRFFDAHFGTRELVAIGPRAARASRAVAANTCLRAADALYVWVAAREGLPLVTLDLVPASCKLGHPINFTSTLPHVDVISTWDRPKHAVCPPYVRHLPRGMSTGCVPEVVSGIPGWVGEAARQASDSLCVLVTIHCQERAHPHASSPRGCGKSMRTMAHVRPRDRTIASGERP